MRAIYPNALIVLWASLECTNFSKAKGGLSRKEDSRTLANSLFRYIEAIDPDYIQIENVEEFMTWGPLLVQTKKTKEGYEYCPCDKTKIKANRKTKTKGYTILTPIMVPDKTRLAEYYNVWITGVKDYLYDFDFRILNAADFGARTSRKRYFGVFAKCGLPIVFPEQTHAKSPKNNLKKWKPVKEVLELEDTGRSVFGRKKPLVEATLWRIHAGLIKFVAGGKSAFMQQRNSGKPASKVIDIEGPSRTLTSTGGNQDLVSTSFLAKYYSGNPESMVQSLDAPAPTIRTKDGLSFISAYYSSGDNVSSIESPAPVVRTKDALAYIKPQCIDQQYGNSKPASFDLPLGAITANPKYNLVTPKWHYLVNPQYKNVGGAINEPCFTLIARMDKMPPSIATIETALTKDLPSFIKIYNNMVVYEIYETDTKAVIALKEFMAMYGIRDIKMRMLKILELLQIMGFPINYKLIGTQAEQKKYIGNAVETTMAKVMCEALAKELYYLENAA